MMPPLRVPPPPRHGEFGQPPEGVKPIRTWRTLLYLPLAVLNWIAWG